MTIQLQACCVALLCLGPLQPDPSTYKHPSAELFEAAASHQDTADTRRPAPSARDQADARRRFNELYEEEIRRLDSEGRIRLVRELREKALGFDKDPVGRFVYLDESRLLSMRSASLDEALISIAETERHFRVDGAELRVQAVEGACDAATLEDAARVTDQVVALVQHLLAEQRTTTATRALTASRHLAQRLDKASEARRRWEWAQWRTTAQEEAAKAEAVLETAPDDYRALITLGEFRCLVEADFERGIPLLIRGFERADRRLSRSERLLRRAVQAEAHDSQDAQALVGRGDDWMNLAKSLGPENRCLAADRASHWFAAAVRQLQGNSHADVAAKKLAEARAFCSAQEADKTGEPAPVAEAAAAQGSGTKVVTRVGLDAGRDAVIVYYGKGLAGDEIVLGRVQAAGPEGGNQAAPEHANAWREIVRAHLPEGFKFARKVAMNVTRPFHKPDHGKGSRCSWSCQLEGRGPGEIDEACNTNEVRGRR